MRTLTGILVLGLLLLSSPALAQFKSSTEAKPNVSESLIRSNATGGWFNFFNLNNLKMHHSYSLSYTNFGGQGLSLGVYTNSLFYKFSDPLDVQVDVSMVHSPFGGLGNRMQNDLSGVYLSRAKLNYRPTENMLFQIQYRQLPPMYWISDPWRSSSFFGGFHQSIREED